MSNIGRKQLSDMITAKLSQATMDQLRSIFSFVNHLLKR